LFAKASRNFPVKLLIPHETARTRLKRAVRPDFADYEKEQ